MTDASGNAIDRYRYSAWGAATQDAGSDDYRSFTGKDYDASGLIYFNARYYDPLTARFLTEDPAMKGGNWYAYCGNNPVNLVDPTGKQDNDPNYERARQISRIESYLEKIVRIGNKVLNQAWEAGVKQGQREQGGIFVQKGEAIYTRNVKPMQYEGGGKIDHTVSPGETEVAQFHSHQMTTGETGVASSPSDIIAAGDVSGVSIIEAGTKRFAIVVNDKTKYSDFIRNERWVEKLYDLIYAPEIIEKGIIKASYDVTKYMSQQDSGFLFFETTDKAKLDFRLVK